MPLIDISAMREPDYTLMGLGELILMILGVIGVSIGCYILSMGKIKRLLLPLIHFAIALEGAGIIAHVFLGTFRVTRDVSILLPTTFCLLASITLVASWILSAKNINRAYLPLILSLLTTVFQILTLYSSYLRASETISFVSYHYPLVFPALTLFIEGSCLPMHIFYTYLLRHYSSEHGYVYLT